MDKRKETLIKALQDPVEEVSKAAAEALEKLGIRDKLDVFAGKIESGEMLDKIRAIYAVADIKGEKVLELLAKAAKDPSEDVRAACCRVLGACADTRSLPILAELLKDSSPMVLRSAIDSVSRYNDQRFLAGLMHLLKNPDAGVIEKALEALSRLGDKRGEDALLYFAVKGNVRMKAIAMRGLGEMDR